MTDSAPLTFPVPVCSCGHTVAQHERAYGSHETRCMGRQAEGAPACGCTGCVDAREHDEPSFCACTVFVQAEKGACS